MISFSWPLTRIMTAFSPVLLATWWEKLCKAMVLALTWSPIHWQLLSSVQKSMSFHRALQTQRINHASLVWRTSWQITLWCTLQLCEMCLKQIYLQGKQQAEPESIHCQKWPGCILSMQTKVGEGALPWNWSSWSNISFCHAKGTEVQFWSDS